MLLSPPAAGMLNLSIRNFRGIDSLDLSFTGPNGTPNGVTVLGGPNGCGKTSVLEACLLVLGHEKQLKGNADSGAVRSGAEDYEIEIYLKHPDTGSNTYLRRHSAGWRGDRPFGRDRSPVINVIYVPSWRGQRLSGPLGITAGVTRTPRTFANADRVTWLKQLLINEKAKELFRTHHNPLKHTASFRYYYYIELLRQAWQMFYPDQDFVVGPVETEGGDDFPAAQFGFNLFLEGKGQPGIPVDRLSSGQLELLGFVSDLLRSREASSIILIDEPELHMDPAWHRRLLGMFRILKPDAQVIAATHSPEIFDSVPYWQRHFLLPPDDPRARLWRRNGASVES